MMEVEKWGISPKQFYTHCKKQLAKMNFNIENITTYEEWINPANINHCVTDGEICNIMPYDLHLWLKDNYNYIMEFQFDDSKKGYGYLYIKE